MLVVFLLDTSASMNQRCASGLSLLDCAKSAVEHFHKVRTRDASCRVDRYMLVTCEDGPDCIKAVDKYPFTHFMRALKSIQARDLTNIGAAMQRIFSFLHVQRLAVDIDRFGQGRNPCSIDPTTIMLLTDGTELTSLAGVTQSLLQAGPSPVGADLSSQPFRWDQRVFATVLRIPSVSSAVLERSGPIPQNAPISGSQTAVQMDNIISAFCEFTGGKCFVATSWKVLMQHTEATATRLPPCVIVSFEHMPLPGSQTLPPQVQSYVSPDKDRICHSVLVPARGMNGEYFGSVGGEYLMAYQSNRELPEDNKVYRGFVKCPSYWEVKTACQRKMLFVRGSQGQQGHWPIPEAFWPDPAHPGMPPRDPHPTIAYKAVDADPFIPPNFTCDKYEIESNPIMGFLSKAQGGVCWQVFIRNSKGTNHGYGDPFGYLRLNRGGTILTLVVLPYNYPVLWQLLEQGGKVPGATKMSPLPQWRQEMERYCNSIPSYYNGPLRAALKRCGLSAHVVPEAMENSIVAGFVGTQLKRLKMQAKSDLDEDMKHILTEQQLLSINTGGLPSIHQGRTLPLMSLTSTVEAPPGFTSGVISGASNNATTSISTTQQARGVGHGDRLSDRKGWEALIPSGPSSSTAPPAVQPAAFIGPVPVAVPGYGTSLGIPNNDSTLSSTNIGVMKDLPIFKNPFDVSREQLLRQLRYLPIRIAVAMDARHTRRMERESGKGKSSAISILAARLAAKEEDEARHSLPIEKMGDFNEALMKQQPPRNPFIDEQDRSKQQRTMFGNPYRQEKNDGADEAWLEGTGGPLFRGRKRRRRSESPSISISSLSSSGSAVDGNSEAASANAEVTSPARPLLEAQAQNTESLRANNNQDGTKSIERLNDIRVSNSQDAVQGVESKGIPPSENETGDVIMDGQRSSSPSLGDQQLGPTLSEVSTASERLDQISGELSSRLDKVDSASEGMACTLRKRRVVVCTPSGTEKDRDEVINFLLSIVKALRYSKPSNTQKLFELLSSPDFPVDKTNFLEQLILQAQRYNKVSVAKELADYRNQLTTDAPSVAIAATEKGA